MTVRTDWADSSKILVIEDDADARESLRDVLELDSHTVETAASVSEALARNDWNLFAAVILDRRLPDGNANELLPRLRMLAPEAAVIIVTGYSDLEGAIEALRLGASDYILKPINPESLRLRISGVVEKRRLALAKERSETMFRDLVEVVEVAIVMTRPDHTVSYFSPFAEQLTGYSSPEVIGRSYLDLFVAAEDRDAVAGRHRLVLADIPIRGAERRLLCRDGSFRWVLKNARCLRNYGGTDLVLIVQHDITERKLAQDRALQAERLAAIGHMVAGLAHESRNALQRSQACLEMLGLKVMDRPEAVNLIARIQAAQDDLQRLFEDVRNYAAPIRLERRQVNLADVWRECWSNLSTVRGERHARLVERIEHVDLHCFADPFRVGQVFRNIFDNALAASTGELVVTVTATHERHSNPNTLVVRVRDNGPGLNSEQRAKIFDSFYTTKTKGTGLGMAIVKRIIDAHGGRVAVGEPDGPGAEIVLTLPRGDS